MPFFAGLWFECTNLVEIEALMLVRESEEQGGILCALDGKISEHRF